MGTAHFRLDWYCSHLALVCRPLITRYDIDFDNVTGCMVGSILGGRWSDHVFVKLREKNGGFAQAEVLPSFLTSFVVLTVT